LPLYVASVQGEKAVLFVVEGDIAHSRVVRVKGEIGGSLYVDSTLAPGARVVVEGRPLLEDGDRVSAKESAPVTEPGAASSGGAKEAAQ
jgi:multidrug efflux pump subunit AcrA (membrane-fusion protein)